MNVKKPMKIMYIIMVVGLPILSMGFIWNLIDGSNLHQMILFCGLSGLMGVLSFITLWLVTD
tara:strand:+ start:382 stop:567 length:186 start_codon:yes stop_codon:yes gene_type:complete